jgi:hypothetical protein
MRAAGVDTYTWPGAGPPVGGAPDLQRPASPHDIHLVDGLSPEQADAALRIFAALRVTRQTRHEQAVPGTVQHLCSVLRADGAPCLLPLPHGEHRDPGGANDEAVSS